MHAPTSYIKVVLSTGLLPKASYLVLSANHSLLLTSPHLTFSPHAKLVQMTHMAERVSGK